MQLFLVNLLLVSGPIREKLWMAYLGFLGGLLFCAVLTVWLSIPEAADRIGWAFPLRGRWLRRFLKGVLLGSCLFCLFLFATSGLGFFLLFPWLAR